MAPLPPGGRNPDDLRDILRAALETLPADRAPTAEELAEAIAEVQSQVPVSEPEMEDPALDEVHWDKAGLQSRELLYEPLEKPAALPPEATPDSSPVLFRLALITAAVLVLLVFVQGFWRMEEQEPAAPEWTAAPRVPAQPVEKSAPAEPPAFREMVDDPSPAIAEEPEPPPSIEEEEFAQAEPEPPPVRRVPPPAEAAAERPRPVAPREEESPPLGLLKPGPGVEEPVPLDFPRFAYPADAHGTGPVDVRLALLVDEQGRVIDARVREGAPPDLGFEETALAVARRIPFQPATRYEVPGKMWTEVILAFVE